MILTYYKILFYWHSNCCIKKQNGYYSNLVSLRVDGFMNKKGITLIELIIVMVIIAIGAVLTAPGISGWLPIYRLRSATRDVVSLMRLAQIKAVSNNTFYRVSFDTANDSYILEYQNTGGAWVLEGNDQKLPTGVKFNTTFAGNITTFSPNSTATNGTIILNNTKGSMKTVRLLGLTGRVRIE